MYLNDSHEQSRERRFFSSNVCSRLVGTAAGLLMATALAAANDQVRIGFIGLEPDGQEPVSLLDVVAEDDGLAGARLAIEDNNATGTFMGQEFILEEKILPRDGDVAAAAVELVNGDVKWILSALPREKLNTLLDAAGDATVFNVAAPDNVLRNEECRANLYHTVASRRMLTDALAQFLIYKRWTRWALVVGNTPEDEQGAEALKQSAERFGAEIVSEKKWPHTPLARRSEGGFHAIQREVPVFLQDLEDHDILLVVDETDYFGEYIPHQTWVPRPVGGTQGLTAAAWHRAHESWGAVQLHRRFERHANRWMSPVDYAAWVAVRSLGEAATRAGSVEEGPMLDYLKGESFQLGAYMGEPVTFRSWDRQLRQPILVAGPRMVVSVSPQEGFLHPRTLLDTLGDDEAETGCKN